MANPTDLQITDSLASTPTLTLNGPTALILEAVDANGAEVLSNSDSATIYLATASGKFQPAPEEHFRRVKLERSMTAFIFEWYGDIKILGSRSGLVVGYAS